MVFAVMFEAAASVPAWIGALGAVWLGALTFLTLRVLRGYAADTKVIAEATATELDNSLMPFVTLSMNIGANRTTYPWIMVNQGKGPAINIHYSRYDSGRDAIRQWLSPLYPTQAHPLPAIFRQAMEQNGFWVEYESLGGKKYRTEIEWVAGDMKVAFKKLQG